MHDLSLFDIATITLTLAAIFGYINYRLLRLPISIGLVIIALLTALVVLLIDALWPHWGIATRVQGHLAQIDFHQTLMQGMLSFLLFAGALHVDLDELIKRRTAITLMATFGVLLSTFLIGYSMFWLMQWLGTPVALIYCLIFGSLIAPTDPVAVMGILKTLTVPASLKAKIAGESLFNDGVGVVIFSILVAIATRPAGSVGALDVVHLFVQEAIGGALLGLLLGYVAYRALRTVDEYSLEVLITLALVMATYSIASAWHLSGPIAVVVAGLLIGNRGMHFAMSASTRDHVEKFWTLLDEILNAALFLIIGFELLAIEISVSTLVATALMIPMVLLARLISVGLPLRLLNLRRRNTPGAIAVLTWGGLRGGISVALALALPSGPEKPVLLAITYGVVIFSIVVQGLSVRWVVQRTVHASK